MVDSLNARLRNRQWSAGFAPVLVMVGIEGAYFLGDSSIIKRVAAFAWMGIAVGMLGISAAVAATPFCRPSFWRSPSRWWYLTAAVLPLVLIYFGVSGTIWTPVSPEGVAQNVVGSDLLRHDHNLGIYTAAYNARYVARQYVLASLPTILFGPSFAALRIGNSLPYVIGYLAFLATMAGFLDSRKVDGLFWSSWAGMMVSLGYYPLMVVRMFEQTAMPLAATMMVAASLLHFLQRPGPVRGIWVAWSMGFLTCGYTPAYGTWALAAAVLLYLAVQPPPENKVLLLALTQGLASLAVASLILDRGGELRHIAASGPGGLSWTGWLWRYFAGFTAVFNAGVSVIPAPLGVAALAVLFLAFKRRDWRVLFVFLWCSGVVLASLTFPGSWFDKPGNEVHRAMIILPVISAGVVMFCAEYFGGPMGTPLMRGAAACSLVFMSYTSVSIPLLNRWRVAEDREMTDFDEAALRISEVAHDRRLPAIEELCIVPPLSLNTFDVGAGLAYFFPAARFVRDAAPIPGRGSYALEFNGRARDADYRTPSKRAQPYIALHEVGETAGFRRAAQRIKGAHGLIADYRFAEGAGRSAADRDGNFEPAQLSGGAGWMTSGSRAALSLSGWDSYLTLPGLPIATREMTLSLWVKWGGGPGEQGLLKLGTPVGGSTSLCLSNGADGDWLRLTVDTPVPPNLAERATIDAPQLPVGNWTLLTIELTGEEAILWIGPAQAGSVKVRLRDPDLLRGNHNWVGHSFSAGPDFRGTIGELQIYGRALSGDEIAALARTAPR